MAARIPKLEPIDEAQPGPTQDLDQVPAQDFVPVVMQDFGHASIHNFGQAPAQDLARQPFPEPAQIPAPVAEHHRATFLPALVDFGAALHHREPDNPVTQADFEAANEAFDRPQQTQERPDDAFPDAEAFAALVKENADYKEQIRVKVELIESLRRTGERAGEPEGDDALPRVSALGGSRPAGANNHQVRPDLARMSRHGTHVDDPIILSDDESHGVSDDPAPQVSERLRVKMEIDDGDGNIMDLEGEAENTAPVDQKALIKMTSDDEAAVQSYKNNNAMGNQEAKTALLNSALARPWGQSLHLEPLYEISTPWVDGAGRLNVPKVMYDDSYDELAKFWHIQMQELRSMDGSWSTLSTEEKCLRTVLLGRNDRWTTRWPGKYACGSCVDERNMCLRQYDGRLWALPLPPRILGRNPILLQNYIPEVELITRSQGYVGVWSD
ncbi:hypothetical protein D6D28_07170 [Aureobasidium pullulans]|uniref:Uncharacterized protein n=1 Tax=Aureobasidium pullulans TaxID=5580 RepID=A0A4S8SBP0_AURPU|nr:hypothetical protein D6D28_07170 [Aureobasidium pullulans]